MSGVDELWADAPGPAGEVDAAALVGLPEAARAWARRATPPGTPRFLAARITMRGEIRLGSSWAPFTAEQVIRWDRGFVWAARTRMFCLPVSGFDRLVDGAGEMHWRVFGRVPLVRASGPIVTRSAAGRLHGEATWLPGVMFGPDARWGVDAAGAPTVTLDGHGEQTMLTLGVADDGQLRSVTFPRYNDLGGAVGYHPFTVVNEQERRFDGVAVGAVLRAGWHPVQGGEDFFRAEITSLEYRR